MSKQEYHPRTLIVFSGGASTTDAVLKAKLNGALPRMEIAGLLGTNEAAGSKIQIDKYPFLNGRGIDVINPENYRRDNGKRDRAKFSEMIVELMEETGANTIAMLGNDEIMPDEPIKKAIWTVNQHPAPLDPGRIDQESGEHMDFGGKSMVGDASTAALLAYLWRAGAGRDEYFTESAVHLVHPGGELDSGKLISVRRVDIPWIKPNEDLTNIPIQRLRSLHLTNIKRKTREIRGLLLIHEHENVIEALKKLQDNDNLTGFTRNIPLVPGERRDILLDAKKFAREVAPQGKFAA